MIKEYYSTQGPANIDLTQVLSAKDSKDKNTNEPTVYIRMTNGDFWNLTGLTKDEFVTQWKEAKGF